MRTTLDIGDDILLAVKERARREKRTAGEVLTELARQSLTRAPATRARTRVRHGFEPFPRRGRVVSNELIDRLREEEGE
jgi:hypothetical protein